MIEVSPVLRGAAGFGVTHTDTIKLAAARRDLARIRDDIEHRERGELNAQRLRATLILSGLRTRGLMS